MAKHTKPHIKTHARSHKKRRSLLVKLNILSVLIISSVFGFYAYASCQDSLAAINNQYKEKALSTVQMVDAMINSPSDLAATERMQKTFDELKRIDPQILKISLYVKQRSGGAIKTVSSDHLEIGKSADAFDVAQIKTGHIVWEERSAGKSIVEMLAPIYISDQPAAVLGVYMNLEPRDIAIRDYAYRALLYGTGALLSLIVLLYIAISRQVFKPLKYLVEGAREVAKGNLRKRIELDRRDELGELAEEFDIMTEALQRRLEENNHLLKTVREKWFEAEWRSQIDLLTNLVNHRTFQDKLEIEIHRADQLQSSTSLVFCDLDKFKEFNDRNGHLFGDKALFEVAQIIADAIRGYDIAARYGGEEFAVILPQTDSDEAMRIGERIRRNVESHQFKVKHGTGRMTVSIGVATYPDDATGKMSLVSAADQAMYISKKQGRNSVTKFTSQAPRDTAETA
ncbi:MAG: diguanylate cyclase [Candidatus Aquicultor sp.]